ncbi:phenylacetate-CoA oxygenase subunit PaaJ [Aquimarina sp. BL5]|uniref:1,2-phenylacetyl-CoA epoxidase subunit PaaD n=1 Tax=Aquimarina sp. BL5 TaxID=1714860 RepID=UPI000E4B6C22|nr:1,2-phenylacetyl-CoA epoxidase subunit PaaD [Aquimarina sp. BL5]AXT52665.1 phenylacetate-CoA oxygenase subunit PaaJ [Aquimarina sp. BL5]RKN11729.1 phenylacetate-CoA oxygenase subunit PaaJ [Aquimarina sp. BL5]
MTIELEQHIDPKLFAILEKVSDPEIPVLSIMDMGVVRSAQMVNDVVKITITPTYSGCPAMDVIGDDIVKAFREENMQAVVTLVLSPAWTTDWITPRGRKALEEYGIAAPLEEIADKEALLGNKKVVKCPQCGSRNTKMISQFGSTACKALFQCEDCLEPFDYFKCLK